MTDNEIARRVQIELDDLGYKFFSEDDLLESIKDAVAEVSVYSEFLEDSADIVTTNSSFYDLYALIPGFIRVISIFNKSSNRYLDPVSLETIKNINPRWYSDYGQPKMYTVLGLKNILIYPKRESVTLTVNYKKLASSVSEFPEQFVDVIELYVISDMLDQLEEYAKSSQYFAKFQERLAAFKKEVENRASRMPVLRP